jgi:DNA-directed RNA polymerase specialized sigma24 family protein
LIPEIEEYVIKNYNDLKSICLKMTKHSSWAEDLLNDVLLQLWEKEDIKLIKLDDNSIKYYIVRCITTNWYSETSPFYRKVKRESSLYSDLKDIADVPVEDNELSEHSVMNVLEEEYGALGWFQKDLLSRYLILGSYKKVSQQTRIPLNSVHNYVKSAKQELKANVFKKLK